MANSPVTSEEPHQQGECTDVEKRTMLRPPNKKRYDEDIEALSLSIKALEDEKTKLQAVSSPDYVRDQLRYLRARKDDMFNKRKNIDAELQKINQNMGKQNSELTRIESTLKYKSEDRTNETITRLEQQLKMRNFTLREERRIVSEIDALKRSKKALVQYMAMKRVVDTMKDQARRMREERERYQKEWTVQKQKEERIKQQAHADKLKCERIKTDLDGLYNRRRSRVNEFRAQSKEYQQMMRQKQEEFNRRKKEEKLLRKEEYHQQLAEYEASRCRYQDEIQLCTTLLTYVQRFTSEPEHPTEKPTDQASGISELPRQDLDGMYILKKKTDAELFAGNVRPKSRKNKREKRRTLSNKPIYHSPEIFEQFSTLKLSAPSNTGEVSHVLHQLETTKKKYEDLSKIEESDSANWDAVDMYLQSLPNYDSRQSPTDGPSKLYTSLCGVQTSLCGVQTSLCDVQLTERPATAAGVTAEYSSKMDVCSIGPESAICDDSIPNTPEVQLDNQPPRFLPSCSPTLSQDSGTVSLDNGIENTKRPSSPTTSDHSTLVPDESPSSRSDSMEDPRTDSLEQEPSLDVHDSYNQGEHDMCETGHDMCETGHDMCETGHDICETGHHQCETVKVLPEGREPHSDHTVQASDTTDTSNVLCGVSEQVDS